MKTGGVLLVIFLAFTLASAVLSTSPASATLFTITPLYAADKGTSASSSTLTYSLAHTPTSGDTLIATVGSTASTTSTTISSITQTGVTWTYVIRGVSTGTGRPNSEIWVGVVGAGAGTSLTITYSGTTTTLIQSIIYEYPLALAVDQTAHHDGQNTNPNTGTTAATAVLQEILIGCIQIHGGGPMSTPTNGFTLTNYATTEDTGCLTKSVSVIGTYSTGVTVASTTSSGCIAAFKPSSAPTSYYYTFSAKYENGTATTISVTETDPSGTSTFNVSTSATYYFTVQPTVFTWTVTGGYPRQIYPTGPTGTYLITQAESTTTLFNIQFKDLANVFASGAATLRISKVISGSSAIVTEFPVPDTISSNPAALIPNTAYTVDLIDHNGVIHALGNYIPLISAQTPTFLLAQTPFAGLIQFVVPSLQYNCIRVTPYTTITVNYVNTLTAYTTPWARVDWKYRNGTVAYSITSSGESIPFTWTGATPSIDYVVTLRVYHTFFGNVTKSFISLGIPFNPAAPISLVGLGNWGGVAASAVVGIIVLLLFAGMGSSMKPGSAAVMLCIVGAVLAYEGWLLITATVLTIALTFAVIMAMNEERRT